MSKRRKGEIDGLGFVIGAIIGSIYFMFKFFIIFFRIIFEGIVLIIKGIINLKYWINDKKSNKNNNISNKVNNIKSKTHTDKEIKVVIKNNKKDNINLLDEETEKEMEALELEEWQKELVRDGEFYTTAFEEEDMDEDSYFYDDL